MIYQTIEENRHKKKLFSLLIDPENYDQKSLIHIINEAESSRIDFILVGGSLLSSTLEATIQIIRDHTDLPVILFPGSLMQISFHADGILFLSLISGRNPELLIGNHVKAAHMIRKSQLEVIPTGYILVNGGTTSSVEYISNTKPIPVHKPDIVTSTAMAGEMLGHQLIYLEAGSGASKPLYSEVIKHVKEHIHIPLIVGGGLKSPDDAEKACRAGADMIVVGNTLEQNPDNLKRDRKSVV